MINWTFHMIAMNLSVCSFLLLLLAFGVASQRDAGILYEVWHTEAATAMREVVEKGGVQLTVERVIQSEGASLLSDVYQKYNLSGDIWNVEPQLGFYCIYRHRSNDTHPPVPDCPNITNTLATHAKWLVGAGFDYIAVDVTNWPMMNAVTDVAVVRPIEVLFEEWLQLRKQGVPTPAIALWPCSPVGGTTWRYLLDLINSNPEYDELVYKQDGKIVVFLPDNPTCFASSEAALIESNGGRNDVVTVKMWALFGEAQYQNDTWGFFSPCTTGGPGTPFTTSMIDVGPCSQSSTVDSATGQVVEVSGSGAYMVSQSALPFASPGHLRGLSIQRLFEKVLNVGAPHLFVSSFNEHIGGRQAPASSSNIAFNMGLPQDPGRVPVWVDTYAAEFSRDVEPTVEGGDRVWQVMSACVSLYKAGGNCATHASSLCCDKTDTLIFSNAWALHLPGKDWLLTTSIVEKDILVKEGWQEVCNPISGPSSFCVDTSLDDGRSGPFMLYNVSQGDASRPLYRCLVEATVQHFFSTDPNCEGQHVDTFLGFISVRRGGETLRALRRCLDPSTPGLAHKHALDLTCDHPDTGILGYVR